MNNREVRQISDEEIRQTLTKEELQQTQVLNFQEVQKTIHFEKITSKKPAIIIAIIGALLLTVGSSVQIATSLKSKPQNIQKRVEQTVPIKKILDCSKTNLNNSDGTDTIYNISYKFEDDKLVGFTKKYNIKATTDEGKKTIENYKTEYATLLNKSSGYDIEMITNENNSISITVIVDYKKLDLTTLKEIQQTKSFTKVDYKKYDLYTDIRKDMISDGYTVE